MPEPGTIALDLTCAECGRSPRAGEAWNIVFVDIAEAATYCPECAQREFGEPEHGQRAQEEGDDGGRLVSD